MSSIRRLLIAGIALLAMVSPATAQRPSPRAAATFGGSFGDGGSTVIASGSFGVHVTRHVGVELELMFVPDLEFRDGDVLPLLEAVAMAGAAGGLDVRRILPILPVEREGRVVAFFSKMVAEFPVGRRLRPYLVGGGGAGQIKEEVRFTGPIILGGERGSAAPTIFPPPFPLVVKRSDISLALTAGGGVDVLLWRGLGAGVDIRYVRLLGQNRDVDLGQVSGRLSYRF